MKKFFLLSSIFFLLNITAFASDIGLSNLTKKDLKNLNGEIATNKKHTSVSAASMLTEDKKYEVGFLLGSSQADAIGELNKDNDPSATNIKTLPYVGLLGVFALPKDLNGEVIVLPMVHKDGFASGQLSAAVKASMNKYFTLPVSVAMKGFAGMTKNEWEQRLSGGNIDVTSTQISYGVDAQVSKKIFMVEPYFNLGAILTQAKLKNSGSASIFNTSYSTSNKEDMTLSSLTYALGAEMDLAIMKVGVEFGSVYSNNYLKAKISTQF